MHRRSDRRRLLAIGLVLGLVLAACGSDSTSTTASTTTSTAAVTTTTGPVVLEQPAIWPAADVVFTTPEAAATDFVETVLRVPPNLGEFQQGDSRSGEMEVFSPDSPGGRSVTRSLLLLRQLGPSDGWFVLAAVNEFQTFTTPESASTVAAGPLAVAGSGRGFEATLIVRALVAGDATRQLDQVIAMGGSAEAPEPFSVSLDLSTAAPGETVMLLLRGDTGRDEDSGEFSAIPVVTSR